ncbi:HAD family phosphatase [Candidatus Woesearchaeota archaeon]|nr:MAG: HAD family phosphatase [Candidatus Woesearchaeota archaeon]
MIKLAIFDLDGLLANTLETSRSAWNALLKECNCKPMGKEEYAKITGKGSIHTANVLISTRGLDTTARSLLKRKRELYKKMLPDVKAMPGALNAARKLSEKMKLALVSNSTRKEVDLVLSSIGALKLFSTSIAGDEICCPKPAPDLYEATLKKLKIKADNSIAFEDSESGIMAACGAGINAIAIPNTYTKRHNFNCALRIVSSWKEITPSAIEKWVKK